MYVIQAIAVRFLLITFIHKQEDKNAIKVVGSEW